MEPGALNVMLSPADGFGWAFEAAAVTTIRGEPEPDCPIYELARLPASGPAPQRRRYAEFTTALGRGQLAVGESLTPAAILRSAIFPLPPFLAGLHARTAASGLFLLGQTLYATVDLEQLVRRGAPTLSPHRSTG